MLRNTSFDLIDTYNMSVIHWRKNIIRYGWLKRHYSFSRDISRALDAYRKSRVLSESPEKRDNCQ